MAVDALTSTQITNKSLFHLPLVSIRQQILMSAVVLLILATQTVSIRLRRVNVKSSAEESTGDSMTEDGQLYSLGNFNCIMKITLFDEENLNNRPPAIGYEDEEGQYIDGKYKEDVEREKKKQEEKLRRQSELNNNSSTSSSLLGARKKAKDKEKKLYIRLVYAADRSQVTDGSVVETLDYVLKGLDPKKYFIQRFYDRNMYAIKQSSVQKPFLLMMALRLTFFETILQLSEDFTFKNIAIAVKIQHQSTTRLEDDETSPIKLMVEYKQDKLISISATKTHKFVDHDVGIAIFNYTFSVKVNQTAYLMVQLMSYRGYQMLEEIDTNFDQEELFLKVPNLAEWKGKLLTAGSETRRMQFEIYCLKKGSYTFHIRYLFVGDLTVNAYFEVNCTTEADFNWPKNGPIEYPSSVHLQNTKVIPLNVSKDVGRIIVTSFSSNNLRPIKEVKLVAPQNNKGWWILDYNNHPYLEYTCETRTSDDTAVRLGTVEIFLRYHNRKNKMVIDVRCDDTELEDVSNYIQAGVIILCVLFTLVALTIAWIFYNRLRILKSAKLLQQSSLQKRKAVELSQQRLERASN